MSFVAVEIKCTRVGVSKRDWITTLAVIWARTTNWRLYIYNGWLLVIIFDTQRPKRKRRKRNKERRNLRKGEITTEFDAYAHTHIQPRLHVHAHKLIHYLTFTHTRTHHTRTQIGKTQSNTNLNKRINYLHHQSIKKAKSKENIF